MYTYLVALGSNIDPVANFQAMVRHLLTLSDTVLLSPIMQTGAEGFTSEHLFLNAVACFYSPLNATQLKADLVALETRLGRNRTDPLSAKKDRPADVDILLVLEHTPDIMAALPPEAYIRPMMIVLLQAMHFAIAEQPNWGDFVAVTVPFAGGVLGERVYRLERIADTIQIYPLGD